MAETTATMIVWPRGCGHGGMVLELVEHHRPYWLGRRRGRQVSAAVPARGCGLSTGLALAIPAATADITAAALGAWAGRRVTLLRYAGCVLGDAEVQRVRRAGVRVEVVDVDGGANQRNPPARD
jgi:hypothetical protein